MENTLKQKLAAGARPIGTFFDTASVSLMECLGRTGLDFAIIDNEHSPIEAETTAALVRDRRSARHHRGHLRRRRCGRHLRRTVRPVDLDGHAGTVRRARVSGGRHAHRRRLPRSRKVLHVLHRHGRRRDRRLPQGLRCHGLQPRRRAVHSEREARCGGHPQPAVKKIWIWQRRAPAGARLFCIPQCSPPQKAASSFDQPRSSSQ